MNAYPFARDFFPPDFLCHVLSSLFPVYSVFCFGFIELFFSEIPPHFVHLGYVFLMTRHDGVPRGPVNTRQSINNSKWRRLPRYEQLPSIQHVSGHFPRRSVLREGEAPQRLCHPALTQDPTPHRNTQRYDAIGQRTITLCKLHHEIFAGHQAVLFLQLSDGGRMGEVSVSRRHSALVRILVNSKCAAN